MNRYPTHGLCELPTAILKVDPDVQSTFDQRWGDHIAAHWNPEVYGVCQVSYRDGHYYVTNHQHVLYAARKVGELTLRCYVREGLSVQEEAQDWLLSNFIKSKTGADRFRIRLVALDEDAVDVQAVCGSLGVRIDLGGHAKPRSTKAVGKMTDLLQKGGRALLANTLVVAISAWPESPVGLSAVAIVAIGDFIWYYQGHPRYSQERLISALGEHDALAVRQELTAKWAGTGSRAPRDAILGIYNRRLTTNALPTATPSELKRVSLGQNPWKADACFPVPA
jgi:hypothetical protein